MTMFNVKELFVGNQFEEDSKFSLFDLQLICSTFIFDPAYTVRSVESGEMPNINSKN